MSRVVAMVGAGLIGASWTALFTYSGGCEVRVWDPVDGWQGRFDEEVARATAQLARLGEAVPGGRIVACATLAEAMAGADFIQENAPESIPLKRALYAEMEAILAAGEPRDVVIASSTSSLSWSELAEGMAQPARLILSHPFNPPHLVPLVELYGQSAPAVDNAAAFYRSLGRHPVVLRKEATGHIANRLASALWREAVHIVAEGIADVAEVDAALMHGPGLRWSVVGAHMAYHLGGGPGGMQAYLDKLGDSQVRRWAALGSPQLTDDVKRQLVEGIAREAEGRTVEQLAHERDERLIAALLARRSVDL